MARQTILMEEEAILKYWEMIRKRMRAVDGFLAQRKRARHRRRKRLHAINDELDEIHLRKKLADYQNMMRPWLGLEF